MKWRVEFLPEVEEDVAGAAAWYEERQAGLGAEFIDEVVSVWDALSENPLLNSRRHPAKNIRWRYPARFPFRIIFEVIETDRLVLVAAVLHAARQDREWRRRFAK